MKKNRLRMCIIVTVCVLITVIAFWGGTVFSDNASYFLLYNAKGTTFNAYIQSKAGVKQYQYTQTIQVYGDLLGDDRTADLHEIEKPSNAKGDVVLDTTTLTLSSNAKAQFTELQTGLLNTIEQSYEGSNSIKEVLIEEANQRLVKIAAGDISYLIPLDCYLELDKIEYDNEEQPSEVKNAEVETFIYKERSNVSMVNGEADFAGKDLTSSLLWCKDMSGISFEDSWLNQSILAESDFSGGDLSGASLLGTLAVGCNMRNCDFSRANLSGSVFIGCDLTGADFANAQFKDVVFKCLDGQKVMINKIWQNEIAAGNVMGIENIEWQ